MRLEAIREAIGKALNATAGHLDFIPEVMESHVKMTPAIFLFYSHMPGFSGGVYSKSFEILG